MTNMVMTAKVVISNPALHRFRFLELPDDDCQGAVDIHPSAIGWNPAIHNDFRLIGLHGFLSG